MQAGRGLRRALRRVLPWFDQDGQGLVEYGLILVLIALVVIVVMLVLVALAAWVLRSTLFRQQILSVGGNELAARMEPAGRARTAAGSSPSAKSFMNRPRIAVAAAPASC